jgi:hypothetical protein
MNDAPHTIAWQGEIEILNATWSLDQGRMVELRICGEAYDRIHPFKRYQQRRGGRMGTRFRASFARLDTGEASGVLDVMLASWKDSSLNAQAVTFWIDDEPSIHPFAGCTRRKGTQVGDMYALVLVELSDDDTAIDQSQANRFSERANRGSHQGLPAAGSAAGGDAIGSPVQGGLAGREGTVPHQPHHGAGRTGARKPRKPSQSADTLVRRNGRFLQYLRETRPNLVRTWDAETAKKYVKHLIKVESLSDLDRDAEAAKRFQDQVRKPFERWEYQHP